MSSFRFFPRSLGQLVLLAFLLVLFPLLILAGHAYISLNDLSTQALDSNLVMVSDTERSEKLVNIVLEIERSYRRYCVLEDDSSKQIYQDKRERYIELLSDHIPSMQVSMSVERLNTLLDKMTVLNCESNQPTSEAANVLEEFLNANNQLAQETKENIFSTAEQLHHAISERGELFGYLASLLFLVSLLFVFLCTKMIIGPVNQVKEMIKILGDGLTLKPINHFNGPREIQAIAHRIIWLSERLTWLEAQRYEFLRHISHELKTPLASMREGTELLADQVVGSLNQDQKDVVAILDNSSRHLQQLIEQLLDYNRRLADLKTDRSLVNLPELIERVVNAHQLPSMVKFMKVEITLDVVGFSCVETLLMRVIDNIYSNAVHYGKESGNIWIRSSQDSNSIFIDIANQGDVIPLEERKMLFEPFYQGSKQRKGAVKGSGLGLSIARDSIYRMKGELLLIDVDYADTCFRIKLPFTTTDNG